MDLNSYCNEHIFKPLRLHDISFTPKASMLERLVSMHQREENMVIRPRKHIMRAAFGDDGRKLQQSGGGGIFCTQSDFCRKSSI
jgi:CubicO group peptidase (beta-lactamase class C family)